MTDEVKTLKAAATAAERDEAGGRSGPRRTAIAGLGAAVPERVLTNADLEKMVDTSDEWIRRRTGIRERRVAEPGTPTSDLCAEATRKALEQAGVAADELDLVIVGTMTPDCPYPATACVLQEKIGASNAAAFDISAMCSGFIYGLSIGSQFIGTGASEKILVVAADVLSSVTDYQDRSTCILFGDAAGAVILVPDERPQRTQSIQGPESSETSVTSVAEAPRGLHELLGTWIGSDGSGFELIWQPAGGSHRPASAETVEAREHYLHMDGRKVFKVAVRAFEDAIRRAAAGAGWSLDDIALIVPHQVNARIVETIVQRLGVPPEKVYENIEKYGNTSAASIPLALYEAEQEGKLKTGDRVVLAAVGGGITWGSAAVVW